MKKTYSRRDMLKMMAMGAAGTIALAACAPSAPAATATTVAPTAATFSPMTLTAPDANYGGEIKSIEATDPYTITYNLYTPDPAFIAKIAFPSFAILPKALLDATGGDSAKISQSPVGTGPMMLKEWVRGDHMTLVPNPNYWNSAPSIQNFIIKWSAQSAQRLLELQSGNVDGFELVGADDIPTVQADSTLQYDPAPATNTLYFGFNNTIKPWDNETIRQAFGMAIDRQRIVDNFFPKGSIVADQFLYAELKPGYTDGLTWYTYDTTKAKQMLTDAGFDFTQSYKFSYRQASRGYAPNPDQIAQDVQAQLALIDVKIELDVQESSTLIANAGLGKLGFYLLGWGEDYPDATDWFDYHLGGQNAQFGNPYPDIVTAIKEGGSTADAAARQKAYDTVNNLIKEHVPFIPVAHGQNGNAFKASVKNVIVGPYNLNFPFMQTDSAGQLVWLQSGEPASLWAGDETDGETLIPCYNMYDALYHFKYGSSETEPALATSFDANADLTQFTFHLRQGVKFSDGSDFTSADVFATHTAMWDYSNPNHKGNTGVFDYFSSLFGGQINEPAPTETPAA